MQGLHKNGSAANLYMFPGSWFAWDRYGAHFIYSFSGDLRPVNAEKVLEFWIIFIYLYFELSSPSTRRSEV